MSVFICVNYKKQLILFLVKKYFPSDATKTRRSVARPPHSVTSQINMNFMSNCFVCLVGDEPSRFVPLPRRWCTLRYQLQLLESNWWLAEAPGREHFDPHTKELEAFPRRFLPPGTPLLYVSCQWHTRLMCSKPQQRVYCYHKKTSSISHSNRSRP